MLCSYVCGTIKVLSSSPHGLYIFLFQKSVKNLGPSFPDRGETAPLICAVFHAISTQTLYA